MLAGSTAAYMAHALSEANSGHNDEDWHSETGDSDEGDEGNEGEKPNGTDRDNVEERMADAGPAAGTRICGLSSVILAATPGMYWLYLLVSGNQS